jgi:hypothetical protein
MLVSIKKATLYQEPDYGMRISITMKEIMETNAASCGWEHVMKYIML